MGHRLRRSNWPEAAVALLLPPACREEVLGDLNERNTSLAGYLAEALRTLPMVIASRIRRTTDPHLLLLHAFVLYLSFYVVAWFKAPALLYEPWALMRLAIPGAATLLALVIEDAYAKPGHRSALRLIRGPALGLAWALLFQASLSMGHSRLALPFWVILYGAALGLLLTSALRLLFSPTSTSPQGRV
jgi:hypothetical protein